MRLAVYDQTVQHYLESKFYWSHSRRLLFSRHSPVLFQSAISNFYSNGAHLVNFIYNQSFEEFFK